MHNNIIDFWFEEIKSEMWWKKDPQFDQEIKSRFGILHEQAKAGELFEWRKSAQGRLAEIIVLDQFSRNIYRDTPLAFAQDPMAVVLAQEAIAIEADQELSEKQRGFLYMPLMHSESLAIHKLAEKSFGTLSSRSMLDFEHKHKVIIERFGRYPHRNEILNRESSKEEIEFLTEEGSRF